MKNIPKHLVFFLNTKPEYFYEYKVEVLPKTSADAPSKHLENILNLMNAFLL